MEVGLVVVVVGRVVVVFGRIVVDVVVVGTSVVVVGTSSGLTRPKSPHPPNAAASRIVTNPARHTLTVRSRHPYNVRRKMLRSPADRSQGIGV